MHLLLVPESDDAYKAVVDAATSIASKLGLDLVNLDTDGIRIPLPSAADAVRAAAAAPITHFVEVGTEKVLVAKSAKAPAAKRAAPARKPCPVCEKLIDPRGMKVHVTRCRIDHAKADIEARQVGAA